MLVIDVLSFNCRALSMPSPIITYPTTLMVKNVTIHPPFLSIIEAPNAVVPITAPPTIMRVFVTFDGFLFRTSNPIAKKNRIIDEMPKLDKPSGFLSILADKNP